MGTKGSIPEDAGVAIIGGGIIGVSIAYYLAKRGMPKVVLLERHTLGSGSTAKCAGGIRTQFSTPINIQMSLLSLGVLKGFRKEFGIDPCFCAAGYLFLESDRKRWKTLEANASLMERFGLQSELLDPDEIRSRWPFIAVNDLIGASYTAKDGYAGPHEVLQGFAKGARRLGAVLIEDAEVVAVETKKDRICAVHMRSGETLSTEIVVNAAGPRAAQVASLVGLDLPVRSQRRQVFFTPPFDDLPQFVPILIDLARGWYMRREGSALLLAGPKDSHISFNERPDFDGQLWAAEQSIHRVPVLTLAQIAGGWAGLYEISPDHHAIIGSFPELKGFICANGFSGHGFQHAAAAGLLIAELIVDGKATTMDLFPLRPQRFRERDLIHEPLTAFTD
jgi:sarcosine oxidase subunit beta